MDGNALEYRSGKDRALGVRISEHVRAGHDPLLARRGLPVQVLTNRLRELIPADRRQEHHRLLDVGNLFSRQSVTQGGRRLEVEKYADP